MEPKQHKSGALPVKPVAEDLILPQPHPLAAIVAVAAVTSQLPPNQVSGSKPFAEQSPIEKAVTYKKHLDEGLRLYGASYKIDLEVMDFFAANKHQTTSPVFTTVKYDDNAKPEAFTVHVLEHFLKTQPEILFEHSALHEIAHIINDDLEGYYRNGAKVELAEERTVMDLVESKKEKGRYEKYLKAYAEYRNWSPERYKLFLQDVKDTRPKPAPSLIDEADKSAAQFFKTHADGKEHLLVYNGTLHDITATSTDRSVVHDPQKLAAVVKEGKPMVFFHNHPARGVPAMYPSANDYGSAALYKFIVLREQPTAKVEFRVMMMGDETTSVSYGFKKPVEQEITKNALAYRETKAAFAGGPDSPERTAQMTARLDGIERDQTRLNFRLAGDSFGAYLKNAVHVDISGKSPEATTSHPGLFLWPSKEFTLTYRGTVGR